MPIPFLLQRHNFEPFIHRYWDVKGAERGQNEKFLKTNLMLAGFALENLFKDLIVQDQRDRLVVDFVEKQELPSILHTHDLCDLAEHARVNPGDDRTRDLLNRMTRHSVWAGRYPVPIRADDLPARDVLNLGPDWLPLDFFHPRDWSVIQSLYRGTKQILEQRMEAPTTESNATSG